MAKPRLAVTLGDPAGIGPEIVVKALARPEVRAVCRPLVVGQPEFVEQALAVSGLHARVRVVRRDQPFGEDAATIDVRVPDERVDAARIVPGRVQAEAGRAGYLALQEAVALAQAGVVDGLVTAPLHKEAIQAAGIPHIGHTEMLAALTGAPDTVTMFQVRNLRIFFFTRHLSLAEACRRVKQEPLLQFVRRVAGLMTQLGKPGARIAVAGLNPHAGDGGLLGREELDEIIPALQRAQTEGINVVGPIGADSVFYLGLQGRYDAVISLYHDQGHIAAKTYDFERTVSLTLGLPFLRASVDHGTAFDIAGRGSANANTQVEAMKVAAEYLGA